MFSALSHGWRTFRLAAICVLLAGCGATPVNESVSRAGIAVIAVVAAPEVSLGVSTRSIAFQLEERLRAAGVPEVIAVSRVRSALGAERHALLSAEVAATNRLVNDALQQVMATPLEARYALFARVEQNETAILEPSQEPLRRGSGAIASDKETVVLASRRDVRVAATLLDLVTGSVQWQRAWTAAPLARADYVRYTGSSFSGSVTATIANSVVNGLRGPSAPPPPKLELALDAIFRELAAVVAER